MPNPRGRPTLARVAEHTPGPWEVFTGTDIVSSDGIPLGWANGWSGAGQDAARANAMLMAAAPDLADACEAMLDLFENGERSVPEILNRCKEALAKAKGQAESAQ